jgi:hypothetical protein
MMIIFLLFFKQLYLNTIQDKLYFIKEYTQY